MKENLTGQIFELEVHDITSEGLGVGKLHREGDLRGLIVFVKDAVPGERLTVEITESKKNYCAAEPVEFIQRHPSRRIPPCRFYDICPGCNLQHVDYKTQLEVRVKRVKSLISQLTGLKDLEFRIVESPREFGYRTHLTFSCAINENGSVMGYTNPVTRRIMDIDECMLAPDWANKVYRRIREGMNFLSETVKPTAFQIRMFLDHDNETVYVIPPRGHESRHDQIQKGIVEFLNRFPMPRALKKQINGVTLITHPSGFSQANYYLVEQLYQTALNEVLASVDDTVLDMYCGTGFYTLSLAGRVAKVISIDSDSIAMGNLSSSSEDLIRLSREAGKHEPDITLVTGRVEELVPELVGKFKPDVVIANPPRSGIHKNAVEALVKAECVRQVVMVSCDPATCSRDMKALVEAGFKPGTITLIDCYPQTAHMELVVSMRKDL